jgi:hypothetical protein
MSSNIRTDQLVRQLSQTLTLYHSDVNAGINQASERAVTQLVDKTKATAPRGNRKSKKFKTSIAWKLLEEKRGGKTYVWYVKPPNNRLTHLLVHGHATKNGGRTKADPFLQNALDEVVPEYEKEIEEVLKNGK